MLKIVQRPRARKDQIAIWQYTCETWDERQANAYLLELESMFETLASMPLLGKAIDSIVPGARLHHFRHHLIVYQVFDDTLEIIRVLHERMDVTRHFA